jgi:hypothetical protein
MNWGMLEWFFGQGFEDGVMHGIGAARDELPLDIRLNGRAMAFADFRRRVERATQDAQRSTASGTRGSPLLANNRHKRKAKNRHKTLGKHSVSETSRCGGVVPRPGFEPGTN